MDRLPRELLDIITDELRTDVPSLRACALSLRDIVPSVQTHLFFKVVLHQPESRTKKNSQCQKFSRLLESSPHLASLVKDFRIIDDEPRFPLAEWRTLSGMLRLFDLKRISIRCTAACLDWDRLHRDFKASLQGVFTSPRLEAIQLHGILISAPPESVLFHIFMGSHANLQHLSVSCQIRKPDHRSRSVPPVWEPKLRSLVVGATHTLDLSHGLFSSTMDGSRLRTLTLSSFKNSEINEFLIAITPRNVLEDLNIHYLDSIGWKAVLLTNRQ
ncbi:hypothetical protein B0H19DRAFT_124792 [Mycena capillaripes]|nr:hypothetical protein B0H19DRAFT_124792 [Mycena capillaripes]